MHLMSKDSFLLDAGINVGNFKMCVTFFSEQEEWL